MHQIKKLFTAKKIITRVRRQPTEWEEIFASCSSYRELIFRIWKQLK
jgi:hypothetical protein